MYSTNDLAEQYVEPKNTNVIKGHLFKIFCANDLDSWMLLTRDSNLQK